MSYRFAIVAATSNTGKTTLTMGLLRALRLRGLKVQPYKCGPDYIDTMFHRLAAGRESVNLDGFMSQRRQVERYFHRYAQDTDVQVIEGVMGLFDGYETWKGSTAELAQWLDIPLVLVVSAQSVAYSVAPLIYGFKHFWPGGSSAESRPPLAGVIFNKVASERHYQFLLQACEDAGVPCFGYVPRKADLTVPGRHLGLTITEQEKTERLIRLVAEEVVEHVEVDRLLEAVEVDRLLESVETASMPSHTNVLQPPSPSETSCSTRILVARDEAFNFTYRTHLDALQRMGEVQYFSPLRDTELPPCDWLFLPGGYPELFANQLSANVAMREAIRRYAEAGGRVYAECGGFMYLCREIDGLPMCGVLPLRTTMQGARLHLGYRQMEWGGRILRGHEFHYSTLVEEPLPADVTALRIQHSATGKAVDTPIFLYKNVMAGYTHWHYVTPETPEPTI